MADSPYQAMFRKWLQAASPCGFARTFAPKRRTKANRIVLVELQGPPSKAAEQLTALLPSAPLDQAALIVLLPDIVHAGGILDFCSGVSRSPDWKLTITTDDAAVRVGAEYVRPGQALTTNAMGFAPLLSMPVTRRAPVVGFGIWAGGHQNEFASEFIKKSPRTWSSFADMPSGLKRDDHREQWDSTTADTKALVGKVTPLRPLTFRLPV